MAQMLLQEDSTTALTNEHTPIRHKYYKPKARFAAGKAQHIANHDSLSPAGIVFTPTS